MPGSPCFLTCSSSVPSAATCSGSENITAAEHPKVAALSAIFPLQTNLCNIFLLINKTQYTNQITKTGKRVIGRRRRNKKKEREKKKKEEEGEEEEEEERRRNKKKEREKKN